MKRVIHFHDVLSLYVSSAVRKTKEGILKNVGIKTYLVTIAFPFTDKKNISPNIFMFYRRKKVTQVWNDMRKNPF